MLNFGRPFILTNLEILQLLSLIGIRIESVFKTFEFFKFSLLITSNIQTIDHIFIVIITTFLVVIVLRPYSGV